MKAFFEQNNSHSLDSVKSQLLNTLNEANKDSSSMQNFVQLLGVVMTKTTGRKLADNHINYVTTRLSNNQEHTTLGTGEGKSTADMLLYAAQALLGKYSSILIDYVAVIERDLQDFQKFFENLDLKAEITQQNGKNILDITVETPLHRQVQAAGRVARTDGQPVSITSFSNL